MRHSLKSNTHSTVGLIHSDFPSEGSAVRTRVLPHNTSLTAGYFYFMFTTYILYSLVRDRYYIGFTSGDFSWPLRKYNIALAGFNGKILDWEVGLPSNFSRKKFGHVIGLKIFFEKIIFWLFRFTALE